MNDADAAGPSLRTFFEGHFGGHIRVMVISIKVISVEVIIRRSFQSRSFREDHCEDGNGNIIDV